MLFNVIIKFKTFEVHVFIYMYILLFIFYYTNVINQYIYLSTCFTTRCGAAGLRITVIASLLLLQVNLEILFCIVVFCFVCCDG